MPQDSAPLASIRIRIACGDEIAMGQGKADLLEAIATTGSIAAAGREMGMSYRKAWLLVDEMNRCFAKPVVEAVKGGAKGGGARVTEVGREALSQYLIIQAKAHAAIESELKTFRVLLAASPRKV
jgi:molybdate transport system regulatory protein